MPPVKYRPEEHFYRVPALHWWFAVGSVLLLVGVVWMIYADWARPWKETQREWRRLNRVVAYWKAGEAAEAAGDSIAAAEKALEEARARFHERRRDLAELRARAADLDRRIFVADNRAKTTKGLVDQHKSEVEAATVEGREAPREAVERFEETSRRYAEEVLALEALQLERRGVQAEIDAIVGPVAEAEAALERARADEDRLMAQVRRLKPGLLDALRNAPGLDFADPSIRIVQDLPEGITEDLNFGTKAPRADRCRTCHLGIEKAEFAVDTATGMFADPTVNEAALAVARGDEERVRRWARVFGAHPNLDVFLGAKSAHPLEKFACSVCHEGQGRQTEFSAVWHMPDSDEKRARWERDHGWHPPHLAERPMLPLKYVEATCQRCHFERWDVPASTTLHRGLTLVSRLGCYACHKIDRFEGWPRPAPSLKRVAGKLSTGWIYEWLADPFAMRPGTRMPRFFGLEGSEPFATEEAVERAAIAHFLHARSDTAYERPLGIVPAGDAERGRALFEKVGCRACHTLAGEPRDRAAGNSFGPELSGLAQKTSRMWLFRWLKDPASYDPSTRMPRMRLTDQEAADLVEFLATYETQAAPTPSEVPPRVDVGVLDRMLVSAFDRTMLHEDAVAKVAAMSIDERLETLGRQAVSRYGCYSCHEIAGFEGAVPIGTPLDGEGQKPLARFDFAGAHDLPHTRDAWIRRKILRPRSFDHGKRLDHLDRLRMPDFGLDEGEADALVTVIAGLYEDPPDPSHVRRLSGAERVAEAGRVLLFQRNCVGCHEIEGRGGDLRAALGPNFGPPTLDHAGARLRADFLFEFLRDPSQRYRPSVEVRMPTFGLSDAEANAIGAYLAHLGGATYPFEEEPAVDPARAAEGRAVVEKYRCMQCHFTGPTPPAGLAASTLGPSFSWTRTRLRHDWIAGWLADPAAQQPGVAMPAFWPPGPDGSRTPEQVREMEAVREYLWSLR